MRDRVGSPTRLIQMSPLMVVPCLAPGWGLDVGGEAEVGTEFEACSERGEHLHGGGGGYHVIGVTGKFHPVVALYDDGVLFGRVSGRRGPPEKRRAQNQSTAAAWDL